MPIGLAGMTAPAVLHKSIKVYIKLATAHIIYASDLTSNRTPFTIGNRMLKIFTAKGYEVKIYDWDDTATISPTSDRDILIGHPHPFPGTIFRKSAVNDLWFKRILLCPYSDHKPFLGYMRHVLNCVDGYIAITGPYWRSTETRKSIAPFTNFFNQNLAVNRSAFPYSSDAQLFNKRVLYVGNKGYWKNTQLIEKLALELRDTFTFSSIGAKLNNVDYLGEIELSSRKGIEHAQKHAFLICPSTWDANPTVIIEAMSLGLIPIASKTSGYTAEQGPIIVEPNNLRTWQTRIEYLSSLDFEKRSKITQSNLDIVENIFSWEAFDIQFWESFEKILLNSNTYSNDTSLTIKDEIFSPLFFLHIKNLVTYIKFYIKHRTVR